MARARGRPTRDPTGPSRRSAAAPGSTGLYNAEEKVVCSGDVLFNMGIGRAEFPGGSMPVLLKSIRERLCTLPDDTVVYSGHGPETTIGYERANNPWLS